MNKLLKVKCPQCHKVFSYYESEFRPFCTERCKMVDLGHWFEESYKVPTKELVNDEMNNKKENENDKAEGSKESSKESSNESNQKNNTEEDTDQYDNFTQVDEDQYDENDY